MFTSRVKEVTRALQHVSYGEVRIRNYLDDEDNFANFEETIIHGLLGCAQDVSATDWGITLQAEVWNCPNPKFSTLINRDIFKIKTPDRSLIMAPTVRQKKIKKSYSTPIGRLGCKLTDWQNKVQIFFYCIHYLHNPLMR